MLFKKCPYFVYNFQVYCPATGIEQYFPCHKWLATDEGDGLILRTLLEQKAMRKRKEKRKAWDGISISRVKLFFF